MDILKILKKMIKKCSNTLVSLVMDEEEPPYDMSDRFTILPNQEVKVHDFPILGNIGNGLYVGDHVAEFHHGNAYTLVNMKSGKVVNLVDEKRNLLVTDSEIDFESIHDKLEHASYADSKNIQFWLKRISEFQDGFAAMAWTIYPEGRWFEDEDGFGAEKNLEEETVYCIINSSLNIVIPFQPMEDVAAVLSTLRKERRKYIAKQKTK